MVDGALALNAFAMDRAPFLSLVHRAPNASDSLSPSAPQAHPAEVVALRKYDGMSPRLRNFPAVLRIPHMRGL
jgi:hypothetical protein